MRLKLREKTKDLLIIEEVLEKDCYRLKSWQLTDPKVIVDVGCHIGCFSFLACNLFPNCKVLSFELIKENFLMAQDNLKIFKNNECINAAVGGKNSLVGSRYNYNNTGGHKAVFKGADSYIGEKRMEGGWRPSIGDIKTVNFQQIFEDYNLKEIDFLKLDCEGSEHEILLHLLETGLINKVKNIALEMHGRDQQECFYILSELKKIYKSVDVTGPQGNLVFCHSGDKKQINFYDLTWENSRRNNALPRFDFACFISDREGFPDNKIRGKDYLQKYNFLGKELTVTPEIIYRKTPELEKFKNKKILVIGGGPTTNWYDWDPNKYDFIFSCNHFFLNEKINKIKIDLAMITNEVDLAGEKFLEYIKTNNTTLVFEDYNLNINNIVKLNEQIDNDIIQCLLRFQTKTGVGAKLIVLATLLGASEVHFVGVDGPPRDVRVGSDSCHSFEKGKKISAVGPDGTTAAPYSYELCEKQYTCLIMYLVKEIGKKVIYKNLGEGHELNMMGKILAKGKK